MATKTKALKAPLPPDVTEADTKYRPSKTDWRTGDFHGAPYSLTFYLVDGLRIKSSWVLTTLPIDSKGRTYGIEVENESLARVGRGPHVKATVTVWLNADNCVRLRKYINLHAHGLALAGMARDRISSRRAMGAIHRANGRTHWYW